MMVAYVGTSVPRVEDVRFLRGEGRYVADMVGTALHLAFVRSSRASARLQHVDLSAALRSPGVVAAMDGRTFSRLTGPMESIYLAKQAFVEATGFETASLQVDAIAVDRTRYVGEPLAVVVATDRYQAEDAAERVVVGYSDLPAVVDVRGALAPEAPLVRAECPGNVAASLVLSRGVVPDGPVVVEGRYRIGRHSGVPLETRGVIAEIDEAARVHLVTSSQIPHHVRRAMCKATGWPEDELRVSVPDVGGGFGTKANIYGEELVACVLARFLRARLSWVEDRSEHLVATAHSRDREHVNRLVLDREGHILGYQDDFVVDLGAHNFWLGGVTANSAIHGLGPYRIPAFRMSGRAVVTHKTPTTQYRGAGRPEACFALERLLDRAAAQLGLTPVEIRRRNLLGRDDLPYAVGVPYHDGQPIVYDGQDYRFLLDRCVAEVELVEIRAGDLAEGERVGVGYAMFAEGTGLGPYETARLALRPDGRFSVTSGGASAGMGQETTLAQIAADELEVPLEAIAVTLPDTAVLDDGVGSYGSRTAANAGPAVQGAAIALVAEARGAVAGLAGDGARAEDVRHDAAGFFHAPTETKMSWEELAQALVSGSTTEHGVLLAAEYRFEPRTVTWTAGAHAAVVAVDAHTGYPRVLAYVAVDEGGRSLNPAIVAGQIKGGIAQAIGGALLEEFRFDAAGQPLTTTLMDYLLPVATDVPRIRLIHVDAPSTMNPLGVRGVGESGAIPGYAAIAAAVDDATGSTHLSATPLDTALIADALDPAQATSGGPRA